MTFRLLSPQMPPVPVPPGALNELIHMAGQYRKRSEYADLLQFLVRFRHYSAYNAMLIRTQKPGAKYVAPARRWMELYKRRVKPGAQAIVILQPRGPVMFVFDVSDTEEMQGAPKLPKEIEQPFEVQGSFDKTLLAQVSSSAVRDGVEVLRVPLGSQLGGQIETVFEDSFLVHAYGMLFKKQKKVPRRYLLQVQEKASEAEQYATVVHELAHLYCGHLGSFDTSVWPDRRGLTPASQECEAESVSYLVCRSLGLQTRSDAYLAGWLGDDAAIPEEVNVDLLLKVVALIQNMSAKVLGPRKVPKDERHSEV